MHLPKVLINQTEIQYHTGILNIPFLAELTLILFLY